MIPVDAAPRTVEEWLDDLVAAELDDVNMVAIRALRDGVALEPIVCVRHRVTERWTGMARHLRETGRHERADLRRQSPADAPARLPWSTARCRSCGAAVVWAITQRGKRMPVDAEPSPSGSLLLVAPAEATDPPSVVSLHTEAERAEVGDQPLHTSHFATCPHADQHRSLAGRR